MNGMIRNTKSSNGINCNRSKIGPEKRFSTHSLILSPSTYLIEEECPDENKLTTTININPIENTENEGEKGENEGEKGENEKFEENSEEVKVTINPVELVNSVPSEISWSNLSCSLKSPKSGLIPSICSCTKVRKGKTILRNLFGNVQESTLVGILGPSGSGKSTLLECLLGRNCSSRLISGRINYQNVDKSSVCFIAQQDYLYDQLTIEESIVFAASVKGISKSGSVNPVKSVQKKRNSQNSQNPIQNPQILRKASKRSGQKMKLSSASEDAKDRQKRIESILDNLWLTKCSKVRVGNCSGGQKKRLSIACELVSNPGFLFLDEPTSGLDR